MKKLLLLAAFAGLLGSSAIANTKGDDKDKKAKKECKAGEKACAGEKKEGCAKGEKSCCKKKAESTAHANTATEKK
jgi:hypothetical protein